MEINNETLGVAAEKVICDFSGLDASSIAHRSNAGLEIRILPLIQSALKLLPTLVKYQGDGRGYRGGQSKSTIDFTTIKGESLSVKTTKNSSFKLCPSECGQPGRETFDLYFGHLYQGKIDNSTFKQLVFAKVDQMLPIYLAHLFDCDYLLHVFIDSPSDGYRIFKKANLPQFKWNLNNFSFTRPSVSQWNESNTVRYNGITLGEFQVHNHRNSLKFRFNISNLAIVMGL